MKNLKKFKVKFVQTETFIVDVLAKNKEEAETKATEKFNNGDYQEVGDCNVSLNYVYDVSNTDDPFNP